jgi:hypothetical protein
MDAELSQQFIVSAREFLNLRRQRSNASQKLADVDRSNRARLASGVVSQSLVHQPIEFSRRGVSLDLTVPLFPVLFEQPVAELRKLFGTELGDLLLDLFESCHIVEQNTENSLPPSNGLTFTAPTAHESVPHSEHRRRGRRPVQR